MSYRISSPSRCNTVCGEITAEGTNLRSQRLAWWSSTSPRQLDRPFFRGLLFHDYIPILYVRGSSRRPVGSCQLHIEILLDPVDQDLCRLVRWQGTDIVPELVEADTFSHIRAHEGSKVRIEHKWKISTEEKPDTSDDGWQQTDFPKTYLGCTTPTATPLYFRSNLKCFPTILNAALLP